MEEKFLVLTFMGEQIFDEVQTLSDRLGESWTEEELAKAIEKKNHLGTIFQYYPDKDALGPKIWDTHEDTICGVFERCDEMMSEDSELRIINCHMPFPLVVSCLFHKPLKKEDGSPFFWAYECNFLICRVRKNEEEKTWEFA